MHAAGGLVYMDGANFNALLGKVRPGDIGVDRMHFNPHRRSPRRTARAGRLRSGRGQSAPGAVSAHANGGKNGENYSLYFRPTAVDRPHAQLFGNFGMMVRAYTYIREMGGAGPTQATEMAVLNAVHLRPASPMSIPCARIDLRCTRWWSAISG